MNRTGMRPVVARLLSVALTLSSTSAWAQLARVAAAPGGAPLAPRVMAAAPATLGSISLSGAGVQPGVSSLPSLAAPRVDVSRPAASAAAVPVAVPAAAPALFASPAVAASAVAAPQAPAALTPAQAVPGQETAGRAAPETPAGAETFPADESARGKTVVMVGTKKSRPFVLTEAVRVAKALGINLVLVDAAANRSASQGLVPDSHFIAAPINERDASSIDAVAEAVAAHPEAGKAHAVVGFLSLYAKLTGRITDRLHAAGIPGAAVAAADVKTETRRILNSVPELAVPFREVTSAEEARRAFRELGGGKFVMKTIRGENSRFLHLGLDSEEAVAKAFAEADAAIREYVARPEAKTTTFAQHPGIMLERMLENAAGSEETSVEVVMQRGKPAFAMVSDTKSIGKRLELAGGSMTFPSQQPKAIQEAFIAAAAKALAVLGITDGSARVDMILTPGGPRVVEVNPYMGAVAIWKAVETLTGMSLVEQGFRAVLGLKVDAGRAPTEVVDYRFPASRHSGTLESVAGLEDAAGSPGIVATRLFVEPGDTVSAPAGNSYEETGEIIGKGKTLAEAMARTRAALAKIVLEVRKADGAVVKETSEYAQPAAPGQPAQDEAAPSQGGAPSAGVSLFSKVVLGFMSTFILVQTVVESTSLAVSQMTEPLTQGFMALAALTSVSYAAYTLGSFLGGRWVDRFGINKTYRTVLVARTIIWSTVAFLYNPLTGSLPIALLIALFSLDYFAHSIGRVAEHKLQVTWFHDSPTASSRFGSFRDFVEYGTVFVASALGLAIAAHGFGVVIYPAPVAFALAALAAFAIKLPRAALEKTKAIDWGAGFRAVFGNSRILKPLAGYVLINSFLYMMYYIIGTAFGAYVTPDPQHASAVSGMLTGIYGIGALVGALFMGWLGKRIDKKVEGLAEPQKTEAGRALYAKTAAASLKWAALALLGSWAFVSHTQLATFVWPLYAISPALLFIGFTAQLASNHLDTIMKDAIPQGDESLAGSILGAIRTLTYMTHVFGFLLWGGLFALLGMNAFFLFAAFYTGVAGVYLWLAKSLAKTAK